VDIVNSAELLTIPRKINVGLAQHFSLWRGSVSPEESGSPAQDSPENTGFQPWEAQKSRSLDRSHDLLRPDSKHRD